jgi:hypothetical protein
MKKPFEPAPPDPGIKPGGIRDRAMRDESTADPEEISRLREARVDRILDDLEMLTPFELHTVRARCKELLNAESQRLLKLVEADEEMIRRAESNCRE